MCIVIGMGRTDGRKLNTPWSPVPVFREGENDGDRDGDGDRDRDGDGDGD